MDDKLEHETVKEAVEGGVQRLTPEERAAAITLAQKEDPGPDYASLRYAYFWFCIISICFCSGDQGFDGTVMGAVNSMTQYQHYFGLAAASKGTSLVFGIYTVGGVCAFPFGATLPDLLGRRATMAIGNTILIAGALLTGFSTSLPMFLGGRWLTGFGCTIQYTGAKTYMAEITSPSNRGRYIGLLNSWYYVGQLVASGISIPLGLKQSEWAWRVPILIQIFPAFWNVSTIFFCPESPRWLYAHGHRDRALGVMAKLHSRDNDIESPLIKLQMLEFEEAIRMDGADKRWWDFRPVFQKRSNRYRFGLTIITAWWGQIGGNALLTYFLPILLGQAGIKDPNRQRQLNFVNGCTSFIGAMTGVSVIDFIGRRKLMLFSTSADSFNMFLIGILLSPAGTQSPARANAGIAFIYLFAVFFSFGWTPLQAVYPSEVYAYEISRLLTALTTLCINTFGLPVALEMIGYKSEHRRGGADAVYLIFGGWNLIGVIFIYIFIVETKRLSLEDLDAVFEASYPRDRSFELQREARERVRRERV